MKVAVLGGGATGLAAAYLLAKRGVDVTIIESSSTAGGLLSTFDVGNGARLETYYHHFFTHDAEINWLFSQLALTDKVLFRPTTMGMLRDGDIYPFNGPKDLLKFHAIGLLPRIRFGASSALLAYRKAYADAEDQPALQWFNRWAGRAATDAIWRPMLSCKFGEAADRIPLAWMAGRLRQRARSRKGSSEQLGYLDGSLQVLVDRWIAKLTEMGVKIQLSTRVQEIMLRDGKASGVRTSNGVVEADKVISTLPTTALSQLATPLNPKYAAELDSIQYLGAICVILAMREPLSSIYWLNVADPGYDFGGIIEQTNFVPPSEYGGIHIAYLSRYMAVPSELWGLSDEALTKREVDQLSKIFKKDVAATITKSWVFRARHAAPLTDIGFWKKIPRFRSPIDGLFVGSMCHVYPDERSVNNSIRIAAEIVRSMGLNVDDVPTGMSLAAKFGHDNPIA